MECDRSFDRIEKAKKLSKKFQVYTQYIKMTFWTSITFMGLCVTQKRHEKATI
ncbi:unnamed protein product [Acanthoscelides obtectus]|uniref:Uncharacterized protein n=1 Tax=Acanthoscelides obtectus TaxID=200917 RepID=A0A9P0KVH7_ACAOB|nr:unnamed protein product [Acanthoscelides obtectus]CAK1638219.1 hypothetical protein AOBTE_LOCUS10463 [Acanthoscelides obtectus]